MIKNCISNKNNKLFFITLFSTFVLMMVVSFLPDLDSTNHENYLKQIAQNQFTSFSKNHIENNLLTQNICSIEFDSSDYDLLDYDDYVKLHKILDRSNINLHLYHTHETSITKRIFLMNNLFPQYPPVEKIIRLKNFLI